MPNSADGLLDAATRLYNYLIKKHWNGKVLQGPDSGIRFNSRVGRFVKSYMNFVDWSDGLVYFQAQGYWIIENWLMSDLMDNEQYSQIALDCSRYVLAAQHAEGYWEYPNPEWKGRIATVEGCYGALGLLAAYHRTRDWSFLAGAKKWYQFLTKVVGFQGTGGLLAVNYFANVAGGMVPNNTTLALKTLAKLADVTRDEQYLETCKGMVAWLSQVQLETGELPYSIGCAERAGRLHFLCYQYNAFEFLDLAQYYHMTADKAIWPVLKRLANFLSTGVSESGAAGYDCGHRRPEVLYYSAAVAAALSQATELGLGDFRSLADRTYGWTLSYQQKDGGFKFFSRRNYGLLSDRRSYPRNLAMILYHLLLELQVQGSHSRKMQALVT
jgi:hypothetical protein